MSGFADYRPGEALSPANIVVRPATPGDVDAMTDLQRRAARPADADALHRAVVNPDRCVVVADGLAPDGTAVLVGWGQTYHHATVVDAAPQGHYLGGVTVDPSWRRRGIALALTAARIAWVTERADEVFYVVNPANLASIDLHRRWSFDEVTRADRLIGIGFAAGPDRCARRATRVRSARQGPDETGLDSRPVAQAPPILPAPRCLYPRTRQHRRCGGKTMGTIVLSQNTSLDGVVGDPTGELGSPRGGWFQEFVGTDRDAWAGVELAEAMGAEALLLGRRSDEYFGSRWNTEAGDWADRLRSLPKYVVSYTLAEPVWVNSTVLER